MTGPIRPQSSHSSNVAKAITAAQSQVSHPAQADATDVAGPRLQVDADAASSGAKALDAKATADSTAMVNRPRTGNIYDDFAPDWVASGGRTTSRDKADSAAAVAQAAASRAKAAKKHG
jgi:hypothetical protein